MNDAAAMISKIEGGDPNAFYDLIKPYESRLYTFLLRLSGSPEDAEELLQDTFMRIYKNMGRFDGRSAFSTWIFTIAMNQFKTYKRKRRLKQISIEELEDFSPNLPSSPSCDETLEEEESKREIRALLGFLKPDQKAAVIMKYMQGFSWQEIGKVLGISADAAKMKVFRARKEILRRFGRDKEVL